MIKTGTMGLNISYTEIYQRNSISYLGHIWQIDIFVLCRNKYSELKRISKSVLQDSVLFLYLLYTRDLPKHEEVTLATFAYDTAILTVSNEVEAAANKLQISIAEV